MNAPVELINYPGSKGGLAVYRRIISEMPPHQTYVEAFLGGGAVFRNKRTAAHNFLLDNCPTVVQAWRNLVLSPDTTLLQADFLTIASLAIYGGVGRQISPNNARGSAVTLADPREESGGWPTSHNQASTDRLSLIKALRDPDTLVYADPPYPKDVRTRLFYECELADIEDHRTLLDLLLKLPCRVMLSGYWHSLYGEMLEQWRHISYPSMTRGGVRTEFLWMNFDKPAKLHDPTFAGANFREREKYKRRKQRWSTKFAAMSPAERQIVLESLLEVAS